MASTFLEDALTKNVDESAISDLVGKLSNKLSSGAQTNEVQPNSDLIKSEPGTNHIQFANKPGVRPPGPGFGPYNSQSEVPTSFGQPIQTNGIQQSMTAGNVKLQNQQPVNVNVNVNVNLNKNNSPVNVSTSNSNNYSSVQSPVSQSVINLRPGMVNVSGMNLPSSGIQIVNMARPGQANNVQPGQKGLQPLIVPNTIQRPGGITLPIQTLGGGFPGAHPGTILVKTENGQCQLVRLAMPPNATMARAMATQAPNQQSTIRLQTLPVSLVSSASSGTRAPATTTTLLLQSTATTAATTHITSSTSTASTTQNGPGMVSAPPSITTACTTSTATQSQNVASQMTPDTAKIKCKNFLATLLRLAGEQPEAVANNVKSLIQDLIDGKIMPEDFTTKLQHELNSSPQPCLVPFLKKSLPYLRQSLATKELSIIGVRPPPLLSVNNVLSPQMQPAQVTRLPAVRPQQQQQHPQQVRPVIPRQPLGVNAMQNIISNKMQTSQGVGARVPGVLGPRPHQIVRPSLQPSLRQPMSTTLQQLPGGRLQQPNQQHKKTFSSTQYREDDDINDVATMGGVNLQEETQKIMGSTDLIGQQIRSCKDELFLSQTHLHHRLKQIALRHGLEDVSSDVVQLVSHATEERLKNVLEKLGIMAEHRLDIIKSDDTYCVSRDIRSQLKFLESIDQEEKRRHEEQEREMLMRAARSRAKHPDDPEHAKLKQKAKDLQTREMEEIRHQQANMTAMAAIGSRKKPKLDTGSSLNTDGGSGSSSASSSGAQKGQLRPRVKRVTLRDFMFFLEQDRDMSRTSNLYKYFLK